MNKNNVKNTIRSMRRSDVGRWATVSDKILGRYDAVLVSLESGPIRGANFAEVFSPLLGDTKLILIRDIVELRNYVKPE